MHSITMFDSTRESLQELLQSVRDGRTQLPDFQRGWVWDDEHIRSLLASVSMSYPIGAVMMLQTGNPALRFLPRPVEGILPARLAEPERLILDGQQRLTALFQALLSGRPVCTRDARDRPIRRWYYIDIRKAVDPGSDRDEAVVGLPEDRVIRSFRGEVLDDYSTTERECAAELLPLPLVFNVAGLMNWMMTYLQADPARTQERLARWNALVQEVIQRYQQYHVPLITLRKETPKEAVCQVFEKVNTGGVSLTVFELLTASFAAEDSGFKLRPDWAEREKRFRRHKVLGSVENTDLLQAITLLATRDRRAQALAQGTPPDSAPGISCKRRDVLRLTLRDFLRWADPVTDGFVKAAKFLHALRIYDARDVPYSKQLVPLAAILAALGARSDDDGVWRKLARWYWCGVFGELYGGAIETRFARDLPEVLAWVEGGTEPITITDANFPPARLLTLRTRNSAAYKGLHALLMCDGGLDFRTGLPIDLWTYFDERIDIHHVFPQKWCGENGIDAQRRDCVVNKAPISARTNRMIGGKAPSAYLPALERNAGIDPPRMDEILRSHVIDPGPLRGDNFPGFFRARSEALLDRIERATGKPVAREMAEPDVPQEVEYDAEEVEGEAEEVEASA